MPFFGFFRQFINRKGPRTIIKSLIPAIDNKMALIVRTDVPMNKGKVAAQCAHAAVDCYRKGLKVTPEFVKSWETFGQTKVTLKTIGEDSVFQLQKDAEAVGLVTSVVSDAGQTQIDPGTITVIGIGPGPASLVDSVTGQLKLY